MGKLILVRHGQTEMNAQSLYFGKLNPPLNDLGISQAYQAKEKLLDIDYDIIYSSPLERAKQTAEICNYLDKEIIFDSNLEEINFGIFEGLTFKNIQMKLRKWKKIGKVLIMLQVKVQKKCFKEQFHF